MPSPARSYPRHPPANRNLQPAEPQQKSGDDGKRPWILRAGNSVNIDPKQLRPEAMLCTSRQDVTWGHARVDSIISPGAGAVALPAGILALAFAQRLGP